MPAVAHQQSREALQNPFREPDVQVLQYSQKVGVLSSSWRMDFAVVILDGVGSPVSFPTCQLET